MELNINIGGKLALEILIDLQVSELKLMVENCSKKLDEIITAIDRLNLKEGGRQ